MVQLDWDYWQGQFIVAAIAVLLVTGAIAVFLVVNLIRKYRQVNQPDTPMPVKFGYYASIAYAIFPIDLLPDPLLIDDIGVLLGALLYVSRGLKRMRPKPTAATTPPNPYLPPHPLPPARQQPASSQPIQRQHAPRQPSNGPTPRGASEPPPRAFDPPPDPNPRTRDQRGSP